MSDQTESLDETASAYLRSTPELKYPLALVSRSPHIVNKIVQLKDNKDELRNYFESLTQDVRGNRHGFAFEVLMDIQDLREFMLGDVNGFELSDTTKWVS